MKSNAAVGRTVLGLTVAAFFGPTTAIADLGAVRSLLEIRQDKVVVQQWDMSCGAAALATVLTYQLGYSISEKRVAHEMLQRTDPMRVKYRGGFSLLDMKRFVESRGFRANGYARLTLQNLQKLAPLIVPVNLEGYDHFVIFRGVVAEDRAVLADPAFGNRTVALAEFEQAWNGNIGFVVRPQHEPVLGNRLPPRKNDLLTVWEDAIRASIDDDMPKPLDDWQLLNLSWRRQDANTVTAQNQSDPGTPMSPEDADSVTAGASPLATPLMTAPSFFQGALGTTTPAHSALALNASPDMAVPLASISLSAPLSVNIAGLASATTSVGTTELTALPIASTSPSASLSLTTSGLTTSTQISSTSPSASLSVGTIGLSATPTSSTSPDASLSLTTSGLTPTQISSTSPSASASLTTSGLTSTTSNTSTPAPVSATTTKVTTSPTLTTSATATVPATSTTTTSAPTSGTSASGSLSGTTVPKSTSTVSPSGTTSSLTTTATTVLQPTTQSIQTLPIR